VLAGALWLAVRFGGNHLSGLSALRDEIMLVLLMLVGTIVYAGSILLLFGGGWLRSLLRS
jgi:putative peptidoglycan lipid II flippase